MSDAAASTRDSAYVPGAAVRIAPTGRGPLDGLRFAAKDLIDIAGTVTGGGNPDWLDTHAPAVRHAWCVSRLLYAGAALEGKTLTDELAYSLEGANHHYGTPRNPRWPLALPGGSSSGSAAAVAAGDVDFALGTDTGGSVRVPAAFCGLFAMRPSHDAVALDGVLPFAPCFDTVGWFARSVDVLATVGETLLPVVPAASDTDQRAARVTLRRAADAFEIRARNEADDAARLAEYARRFGARTSVEVFSGGRARWLECYRVLQDAEIDATLGAWLRTTKPRFGPSIAPRFAGIGRVDQDAVAQWRAELAGWRAQLDALLDDTILVMPTTPVALLPRNVSDDTLVRFYEDALTLDAIAAIGGLPQITIPLADEIDRPLALSLIGARGSDRHLLTFARDLLRTTPTRTP